jgi:hypothetical protein
MVPTRRDRPDAPGSIGALADPTGQRKSAATNVRSLLKLSKLLNRSADDIIYNDHEAGAIGLAYSSKLARWGSRDCFEASGPGL